MKYHERKKISILIGIFFIVSVSIFFKLNYILIKVDGDSMDPTYYNKQLVFGRKGPIHVQTGDVVVFEYDDILRIKRIAGEPGDRITIKNNNVYVNNTDIGDPSEAIVNDNYITLKDHEYFVLGDNLDNSIDSRDYGPIKKEQIKGKIF